MEFKFPGSKSQELGKPTICPFMTKECERDGCELWYKSGNECSLKNTPRELQILTERIDRLTKSVDSWGKLLSGEVRMIRR